MNAAKHIYPHFRSLDGYQNSRAFPLSFPDLYWKLITSVRAISATLLLSFRNNHNLEYANFFFFFFCCRVLCIGFEHTLWCHAYLYEPARLMLSPWLRLVRTSPNLAVLWGAKGCACCWATWKHLVLQMFCFFLLPFVDYSFVCSLSFFFFFRLDVTKSIVACLFLLPCAAPAQSKANQMEKIMTVIRLYRLTLHNERRSQCFVHHQQWRTRTA